jgi:hypothetical protein
MPPDTITSRMDGWIGSLDHMPTSIAEIILRAMPPLGEGDSLPDIYARMVARQLSFERKQRTG